MRGEEWTQSKKVGFGGGVGKGGRGRVEESVVVVLGRRNRRNKGRGEEGQEISVVSGRKERKEEERETRFDR